MIKRLSFSSISVLLVLTIMMLSLMVSVEAQSATKYKVAWSVYAGWQPWDYASYAKILDKWATKYGIVIELNRMDYIPSIEAYAGKEVDACVMTNMDALAIPAATGVSSTVVILGDFSNGNDALLVRDNLTIRGLKGVDISLVELSVSQYLLARALDMNGMKESDVDLLNTSDADIAGAFISDENLKAVVTWNPMVMNIAQENGISNIFDSSSIPGEILDLMMVRTEVLDADSEKRLAKALTGAWYEVMGIMSKRGARSKAAMKIMAESAGCTLREYQAQLKTTAMFYKASQAAQFMEGTEIKTAMARVIDFCFTHDLLGEMANSADDVGVKYPDGTYQGDPNNIQIIFDSSYTRMSANGTL